MKYLVGLVFLVAHTFGEAPAPYPASGWRPQGPAFELPSENNSRLKQTVPPSTSYGVPELQYGAPGAQQNVAPPQNRYGPPAKQLAPQTQYGTPQRLPPTQLGPPQSPQQVPQNQYGAPSSSGPQSQRQVPQNQYGAPSSSGPQSQQQAPQNQYGAPSSSGLQSQQQVPQNQYGAPSSSGPQSQQQIPQNQFGAPQNQYGAPAKQFGAPQLPQSQQQTPQNQFGAPQNQYGAPAKQFGAPQIPQSQQNQFGAPSYSFPQNLYGAPFQQTEIKLTPQQQQLLLTQLIKLQQFLSSQKRQQVAPQNEYGAPPSSVDVRGGGGANNPQNHYEPPSGVEPLNGDQSNQFPPNTQYLPSEVQPSFRSENNGKRLSFSGDQGSFESQNQNQDDEGYKTIVLSTQEEDDYNKKYGAPNSPPVTRRRPQSIPDTPKDESDGEESFDDASADPNISVANAFASGRYYLLLPDGRLQKVVYKTTQSEEEAKSNGFTANLMYQLVEPIKDPIYTVDGTPYVPVSQN